MVDGGKLETQDVEAPNPKVHDDQDVVEIQHNGTLPNAPEPGAMPAQYSPIVKTFSMPSKPREDCAVSPGDPNNVPHEPPTGVLPFATSSGTPRAEESQILDASYWDVFRQWFFLGWTAFGGPSAHLAIFQKVSRLVTAPS